MPFRKSFDYIYENKRLIKKNIMKTVFYWSPCLSKVGTVKSTLNSALALSNIQKKI